MSLNKSLIPFPTIYKSLLKPFLNSSHWSFPSYLYSFIFFFNSIFFCSKVRTWFSYLVLNFALVVFICSLNSSIRFSLALIFVSESFLNCCHSSSYLACASFKFWSACLTVSAAASTFCSRLILQPVKIDPANRTVITKMKYFFLIALLMCSYWIFIRLIFN